MADSNSALPSAMQARMAALEAESTPSGEVTTPATPAATPTPTEVATTVTITRDEFNELQANAGKARQAQAQAESARLANEEAQHRLTELEKASKSVPAATPTPALQEETVTFTEEEEKDFGDSREFITKVVKNEVNKALRSINDLVTELRGEIGSAKTLATTANTTVVQSAERRFFAQVKESVPNLDAIVKHKNWSDFLDHTDELSGATYHQLLGHNIKNENLNAVKKIYQKFSDQYLVGSDTTVQAGYAGGAPSGGAVQTPVVSGAAVKLKQSDRRKASEDYRKGKITWDNLQEVSKKFDEAEKSGNIEYD